MSRDDGESPSNPFVRFKHHVDANIASGITTLIGESTPTRPCNPSTPALSTAPSSTNAATTPDPHALPSRAADMDVFSIASSIYAPAALRHLPAPVPNHLPSHFEPALFTFEDAFEDLLVASQGQPLPDITTRYEQRKLLIQMFPAGEPSWFWLRRLQSQGLVSCPSPSESLAAHMPNLSRLQQELEQAAPEVWRRVAKEAERVSDKYGHELDKAFEQLEQAFSGQTTSDEQSDPNHGQRQRPEPDTFDELFSTIRSSFTEGQQTWETFLKTISENTPDPAAKQTPRMAERGNKEANHPIETREEYVDRFGYLHSTVTRTTLDKDGNEVGRETHFTMCPATEKQGNAAGHKALEHDASDEELPESKKSGWFWK